MHLAGARQTKVEDTTDDDLPSTSGRQFTDTIASDSAHSNDPKVVLAWGHILFGHMQQKFNFM